MTEEQSELESQLSALESENVTLEGDNDYLRGRLEELEDAVATLRAALDKLTDWAYHAHWTIGQEFGESDLPEEIVAADAALEATKDG